MSSDCSFRTLRIGSATVDCLKPRPQTITRHGKPAAVVLSVKDYERIKSGGTSLTEFFARSPLRGVKLNRIETRPRPRARPMKYLLDTSAISELVKPKPNPRC